MLLESVLSRKEPFFSVEKTPAWEQTSVDHKPGLQTRAWSLSIVASRWHSSFVNILTDPWLKWSCFLFPFSLQLVTSLQEEHSLMAKNSHEKKKKRTRTLYESFQKPRTFTQLLISVSDFCTWPETTAEKEAAVWMGRAGSGGETEESRARWGFLHWGRRKHCEMQVKNEIWGSGRKGERASVRIHSARVYT